MSCSKDNQLVHGHWGLAVQGLSCGSANASHKSRAQDHAAAKRGDSAVSSRAHAFYPFITPPLLLLLKRTKFCVLPNLSIVSLSHSSSTLASTSGTTPYLLSSLETNPLPESQIWYSLSISHSADFVLYLLYCKYCYTHWRHNENTSWFLPYRAPVPSFHPSYFSPLINISFHFHFIF